MSARRFGAVKILSVLLMIPLLGALGAYVWINRIADQRWAAAEARIRELSAAFPEERPGPPERGTEAAKDNQIHFVAAIRLAAPKRNTRYETWYLIQERIVGAVVDATLDDAQDFLDRLHEGGRRIAATPADFPPRWRGDWDYATLDYMLACAILRSRRRQETPFEAAQTLLDALQLGRFWAISGKRFNRDYALDAIVPVLDELRGFLSTAAPSPEELRRIAAELQGLEDAIESPLKDLDLAFVRWAESLEKLDPNQGWLDDAPLKWKYLLPSRLMKAEAFEFQEGRVKRLRACEGRPFSELVLQSQLAREEQKLLRNPLAGSASLDPRWKELRRKTELRLLRIGAHYRATGEILTPGDPYGTSLLHSEQEGSVKFWSVGSDGLDNGGDAGKHWAWWHPGPIPGRPALPAPKGRVAAKDIVLEVPRRP